MAKEKPSEATNSQSEKLKALQAAMSKIEKDFGKGSIMKLGDEHVGNWAMNMWRTWRSSPQAVSD